MPKNSKGALFPRQLRFVAEYLISYNATTAALRAGYSPKTAARSGSENLQKPLIQAAIARAENELADRLQMDASKVLAKLVSDLNADMADIFHENGSIKAADEWPLAWRTGLVASIDVTEIYRREDGRRVNTGRVTKVRFADRFSRLIALGNHRAIRAFDPKFLSSDSSVNPFEEFYSQLQGTGLKPKNPH